MSNYAVALRALHSDDMAFIERLYASTRALEMSHTGWPADQVAVFLRQQFGAQHAHYQAHFSDGEFFIIEHQGQAIGRLYLRWGQTTLTLIDIALLPQWQNLGIGSALLTALTCQADERGLAIELSVETYNPAQGLYARLGFQVIDETGVYLRMRRDARAMAMHANG